MTSFKSFCLFTVFLLAKVPFCLWITFVEDSVKMIIFCIADNIQWGVEQSQSSAEHESKVDEPSAERIKLVTDVPNSTGSENRALHAHIFDLMCFRAMSSDGRNAMTYDRAGLHWETHIDMWKHYWRTLGKQYPGLTRLVDPFNMPFLRHVDEFGYFCM